MFNTPKAPTDLTSEIRKLTLVASPVSILLTFEDFELILISSLPFKLIPPNTLVLLPILSVMIFFVELALFSTNPPFESSDFLLSTAIP